ncbi:MAG TPA: hypothetical protein VMU31_08870, partial [Rhizomicrobium sp.]|nr:hypothetical protein [Rhizomicrobium sp.]
AALVILTSKSRLQKRGSRPKIGNPLGAGQFTGLGTILNGWGLLRDAGLSVAPLCSPGDPVGSFSQRENKDLW